MHLRISARIRNTKDVTFEVLGHYWDDGTFYLKNPKPEKYPDFAGLLGSPDSCDLHWVRKGDDTLSPCELSRFRLDYLLLEKKPRTRKTNS